MHSSTKSGQAASYINCLHCNSLSYVYLVLLGNMRIQAGRSPPTLRKLLCHGHDQSTIATLPPPDVNHHVQNICTSSIRLSSLQCQCTKSKQLEENHTRNASHRTGLDLCVPGSP